MQSIGDQKGAGAAAEGAGKEEVAGA